MSNEKPIEVFFIGVCIGLLLGVFAVYYIYSGQLDQRDTELTEHRARITELEQQYSDVTRAKEQLGKDLARREAIERATDAELQGIGSAIDSISIQGASIAEKLRRTIDALAKIQTSLRNIEQLKLGIGQ